MSQIKSTDAIILFNLKTKNYLSYPVRSTGNWEIVTSGHDECPHTIHVLGKPNGIVKSGELVKFESQATSYEGFNQLYCSSRGFCWYDKINPKDPKQIWRIVRKDKSHVGDDILNGDIVHIESVWYPDAFIFENESGFVEAQYGRCDPWEITLAKFAK